MSVASPDFRVPASLDYLVVMASSSCYFLVVTMSYSCDYLVATINSSWKQLELHVTS